MASGMAYGDSERDILTVGTTIVVGSLSVLAFLLRWKFRQDQQRREQRGTVPLSVNYHFTRQCNYQCGFCFHTAKTSFVLPIDEAKRGLKMLKEAGMAGIV